MPTDEELIEDDLRYFGAAYCDLNGKRADPADVIIHKKVAIPPTP